MVDGTMGENSHPPLYVFPGYGESKISFEKITHALASLGERKVVMHYHPPIRELFKFENDLWKSKKDLENSKLAAAEDPRVQKLLNEIPPSAEGDVGSFLRLIAHSTQHMDVGSRIDGVGHSQGALYLLIAAAFYPHLFRKIVLLYPSGWTSGTRDIKEKWQGIKKANNLTFKYLFAMIRSRSMEVWLDGLLYIASRPVHSLLESHGLATTSAYPYIELLEDLGVEVSVIYDDTDRIFPPELIEGYIPKNVRPVTKTHNLGHFAPTTEPEKVAEVVIHHLNTNEV